MNFGTPVPLLVGIVLILVAVGLFFLDRFKPGYRRDSDTVYSVLFLTVGILCLFQLNQDFMPSFQMMIFAGMLISLMIESIQRRGAQVKQTGSGMPFPENDRPSRSYRSGYGDTRSELRVELDDDLMEPLEESSRRRIRGTRDERRDPTRTTYVDQLADETRASRRSTTSRRSSNSYGDDSQSLGEDRPRRRPLQLEGDVVGSSYLGESPAPESGVRRRGGSSRPIVDSSPSEAEFTSSARSKRRRPRLNGDRPTDETYVDYKPLNPSEYPGDNEFDNSSNFDDDPSFR